MSDDFERKLSIALKAATHDLARVAVPAVRPLPVRHRGRPRLVLAVAVVVLLVVGVGGAWWAVSVGHDDRSTPADGAPCTAADVTGSRLPDRNGFLAVIGIQARDTCTVTSTPTLLLDKNPVYWRTSDRDATDPSAWTPFELAAGDRAVFGVSVTYDTTANCPAMFDQQATFHFALDAAADVVSFPQTVVLGCASFAFTTLEPGPPAPVDASTPCTPSDLDVVPYDVGAGIDEVDLDVIARVDCTLRSPPAITVDTIATTPDVRGNPVGPWTPTRLAAGQSVTLGVNPNYLGACTALGPRQVRASLGGTELAVFAWMTATGCPGTTFGVQVHPDATAIAHPCVGSDVTVRVDTTTTPATVLLSGPTTGTCTLVDPPTVVVGRTVAAFGVAENDYRYGGWSPVTVGSGADALLALSFVDGPADCSALRAAMDVTVSVDGVAIASTAYTPAGCGTRPVTFTPTPVAVSSPGS